MVHIQMLPALPLMLFIAVYFLVSGSGSGARVTFTGRVSSDSFGQFPSLCLS